MYQRPRHWASTTFTPHPICARSDASFDTATGPIPPSNHSFPGSTRSIARKSSIQCSSGMSSTSKRAVFCISSWSSEPRRSALGRPRRFGGAPGRDLALLVRDVALFVQPSGELFRHGARGAQQLLARHHLAHHEPAEELAEVVDDLLRTEKVAVRLLVARVEGCAPALLLALAERVVRIAVQRIAEQVNDVLVVAEGLRRQSLALLGEEGVERLVDRHRRRHDRHPATLGG